MVFSGILVVFRYFDGFDSGVFHCFRWWFLVISEQAGIF